MAGSRLLILAAVAVWSSHALPTDFGFDPQSALLMDLIRQQTTSPSANGPGRDSWYSNPYLPGAVSPFGYPGFGYPSYGYPSYGYPSYGYPGYGYPYGQTAFTTAPVVQPVASFPQATVVQPQTVFTIPVTATTTQTSTQPAASAPASGTTQTFVASAPATGTAQTYVASAPASGTTQNYVVSAPASGTAQNYVVSAPATGSTQTFFASAPVAGTGQTFVSAPQVFAAAPVSPPAQGYPVFPTPVTPYSSNNYAYGMGSSYPYDWAAYNLPFPTRLGAGLFGPGSKP